MFVVEGLIQRFSLYQKYQKNLRLPVLRPVFDFIAILDRVTHSGYYKSIFKAEKDVEFLKNLGRNNSNFCNQ